MKFHLPLTIPASIKSNKLLAYYELTKPGITYTVLASMAVGFLLGSGNQLNYFMMVQAMIGTWLVASGTAAHNQYLEWRLDGKMSRTQHRPLPSNKIEPRKALFFSLSLILGGLCYLIIFVNHLASLISLATTLIYLGIYTPMKRVSALNVFIGAIPGALPPIGGWAAATGQLGGPAMWALFGIVFLWQIPHVLAIARVCKEDYQQAGFQMLPQNDHHQYKITAIILVCLMALIPTSCSLYYFGLSSWMYLAGALISGLVFLLYGILFAQSRRKHTAKKLMMASFIYLPVIWTFVLISVVLK